MGPRSPAQACRSHHCARSSAALVPPQQGGSVNPQGAVPKHSSLTNLLCILFLRVAAKPAAGPSMNTFEGPLCKNSPQLWWSLAELEQG